MKISGSWANLVRYCVRGTLFRYGAKAFTEKS